jgi:hypothetical protein
MGSNVVTGAETRRDVKRFRAQQRTQTQAAAERRAVLVRAMRDRALQARRDKLDPA